MTTNQTSEVVSTMASVRHYCTLFNRNYLIKGLALYLSLERVSASMCLHVLCMDDETADILGALGLKSLRIIRLTDFETKELLEVKKDRTIAEYCWTCAPCLLCHLLDTDPAIDLVTYLDADLLFYSSPEPLFEEMGGDSTLIVEHRFSPRFQESIVNGRYNVQWVGVRRDAHGLQTVRWWRDRCIEWCYYRVEEDRMGDQKYLDKWPILFKGVHDLQHVGGGVAPWNFANYDIREAEGKIFIDDVQLVFYHFHSFRMLENGEYVGMPAAYTEINPMPLCIYERYNAALLEALARVQTVVPGFSAGIEKIEDIPISRPTTKTGTQPHAEPDLQPAPESTTSIPAPASPFRRVARRLRRLFSA